MDFGDFQLVQPILYLAQNNFDLFDVNITQIGPIMKIICCNNVKQVIFFFKTKMM